MWYLNEDQLKLDITEASNDKFLTDIIHKIFLLGYWTLDRPKPVGPGMTSALIDTKKKLTGSEWCYVID